MSFYTNPEICHVPAWVEYIWDEDYFVAKSAALKIQSQYRKFKKKIDRYKLLQKAYFKKSYRYPKKSRRKKVRKSKMRWYETGDGRGTLKQAFRCARTNNMNCFTFVTATGNSQLWHYTRVKSHRMSKTKYLYLKEWRLIREFS